MDIKKPSRKHSNGEINWFMYVAGGASLDSKYPSEADGDQNLFSRAKREYHSKLALGIRCNEVKLTYVRPNLLFVARNYNNDNIYL